MGLISKLFGGSVHPAEAQVLLAQGALLVDVRERSEWAQDEHQGLVTSRLDSSPLELASCRGTAK